MTPPDPTGGDAWHVRADLATGTCALCGQERPLGVDVDVRVQRAPDQPWLTVSRRLCTSCVQRVRSADHRERAEIAAVLCSS